MDETLNLMDHPFLNGCKEATDNYHRNTLDVNQQYSVIHLRAVATFSTVKVE